MTPKQNATLSKDDILSLFSQLVDEQQGQSTKVITREEQAVRAKDRQAVEAASQYSVESIVKGLPDLQLSLGGKVDELLARLLEETAKLDEQRRAIEIEEQRAKYIGDVKVAADALHVQTLENQEEVRQLEQEAGAKRQTQQQEIENTRAKWQKERKQLEQSRKDQEEQAKKDRAKAEADFGYDLERKRKVESDAFGEKKRKLERDLAEQNQAKEKAWTEREKLLADKQAELEANLARIATLPQELEDAVKKARDESIRDASNDARVKAELRDKEIEGNRKVFDLQIQALETQAAKLAAQIESLSTQLQTANREVQELALRAIEGSRQNKSATSA